ncbi:hypothetical protein H310_07711 [Aphanomyces invadans]|uniref:Uncharacterized protein n=1 Tax=Aphanomyces invadans TaxID=157072 RepID=A0A024U1Z3_9STRA|nr:hypothetical protein H310_07711 [Aphanomyces invadans]ETV99642.1 hypothetical protein H310_07711 [Aphanomyces invadans]|eukprot:XP_008871418.1 hypothetical protein H310_07711 [Aphanomyces invadans]
MDPSIDACFAFVKSARHRTVTANTLRQYRSKLRTPLYATSISCRMFGESTKPHRQ